jgi:hypothetical protein
LTPAEIIFDNEEHNKVLLSPAEMIANIERQSKEMGEKQEGFWIPELAHEKVVGHKQEDQIGRVANSVTMVGKMDGMLTLCS